MGKTLEDVWKRVGTRLPLVLGLLTLAFMSAGLFQPDKAFAVADLTNLFPPTPTIVSNSNASPVSGKFTVGAGQNRLLLVAVATRYSGLPGATPVIAVNYGGQALTAGPTSGNVQSGVALFYLKESGILSAGANKTLTVTNSTTGSLTNMYATAAAFNGIDQTAATITGSAANGLAAAAGSVATSYTMAGNNGLTGNEGLTVYVTNWNGNSNPSIVTGTGTYLEIRDFAGSGGATNNINLAGGYKFNTANATENPSSAATSNLGAIAAISLNPILKPTTVASCGDCHGNPPEDATGSRGTPVGMFVGSHNKHSGGNDLQYGYACTACHYNQSTYNHASGFKNITGSRLPGNAYTAPGGKKIAVSNLPTFGTCNVTACHSTGRSNVQYTAPPNWGTNGTVTCLSCHAGRSGAAGPQANSTAGFKLSSSHSQHLKPPYTAANINCNHCHGSVASDAATLKNYSGIIYHANGTVNVIFKDLAYGTYTAFKTGKTCQNVACHGGKTRNGWQNTSINTNHTCTHCHGTATGISTSNTNPNYYAPGYNGGTSTDQISVNTDIRVGAHYVHLSSVYIKKMKCNECHRVPATAFDGTHMTGPRYNSQSVTFAQASTAIKNGASPAVIPGTAIAPARCDTTFCHGSNLPKGDTGGTDKNPLWNANLTTGTPGTAECARCHGNPPLFGSSSSAHIGSAATISCIGCHKNVTNAAGTIINKALHINGAVNMIVDTSTSTSCNKCHGNPPQGAIVKYGRYSGLVKPAILALGASPANMGAHAKHASSGVKCDACHTNSTISHPDAKLQIFFRITSATITGWNTTAQRAPYGTYSGNSGGMAIDTSSTLIRTTASTNNSCNTYCHGGWNNSNRNLNPKWTDTAAVATACGACHGATAVKPPLIASHARHAGYSSATTFRQGYSFSCAKCHPNRAAADHVKGAVHVRYSTAVLGTTATYTKTGATLTTPTGVRLYTTRGLAGDTPDGTCSNITCHSTGRGAGMGTTSYTTTPQWGNTTRNCLGCHGGRASALGAPARSSSNFTLSTTHSQHLKYPAANINCQTCHSKVATNAATLKNFSGVKLHANGTRNMDFGGVLYGSYTSYKTSGVNQNKCTNITCHGGKSRGAWSATVQNNDNSCVHCHGVAGTSAALPNTEANRKFFAPGWNSTGISTDGIAVNTDPRVGGHFVHLSSVYMKKLKCNECHTVPSNPFDGTHMTTTRYNSQSLVFNQASTATKNSVVPAFTPGFGATPANCTTTFCHGSSMPKGDTSGTDKSPNWSANLTTGTPSAAECARCHGNPPTAGTSAPVHSGATATTGCAGCHPQVVSGTGAVINKALHMNGTVEAITACNGCHDYDTNNAGLNWGNVKNVNYGVSTEGRGGALGTAHAKHIEYLKTKYAVTLNPTTDLYGGATFQVVCGPCHSWNTSNHSTGTPSASRSINLGADTTPIAYPRTFGGNNPTFNGLYNTSSGVNPKSCSNLDCHYRTSPIWSTY